MPKNKMTNIFWFFINFCYIFIKNKHLAQLLPKGLVVDSIFF